MNRAKALEQIVTLGANREAAYSELVKFGYDAEIKHFVVSKSILERVLLMFLSDKITSDELEQWANFIECRDDLDYEIIEGYVYALANPYSDGDINKAKITKMLRLLKAT